MADTQTTTDPSDPADQKKRRVTIDLTPAAADAVDHIKAVTGLSTADVFRNAFNLFRFYVEEKRKGAYFQYVGEDESKTRIELPGFTVSKGR